MFSIMNNRENYKYDFTVAIQKVSAKFCKNSHYEYNRCTHTYTHIHTPIHIYLVAVFRRILHMSGTPRYIVMCLFSRRMYHTFIRVYYNIILFTYILYIQISHLMSPITKLYIVYAFVSL